MYYTERLSQLILLFIGVVVAVTFLFAFVTSIAAVVSLFTASPDVFFAEHYATSITVAP